MSAKACQANGIASGAAGKSSYLHVRALALYAHHAVQVHAHYSRRPSLVVISILVRCSSTTMTEARHTTHFSQQTHKAHIRAQTTAQGEMRTDCGRNVDDLLGCEQKQASRPLHAPKDRARVHIQTLFSLHTAHHMSVLLLAIYGYRSQSTQALASGWVRG